MVSIMLPERLQRQKQKANAIRSNKAVAYIRVSTDDQVYGESLDTQRKLIQQYAEREGLEIVKWFIEEGKSAKTVEKRDAVKDMLTYLARNKGKIGYSVFYKMWRASRDAPTYYTHLKSTLNALSVAVRSATEPIDDTSTGRWLEGMLVLNGQLDNDIKSGVTKDNMASVAKQGWWQGGSIPGYDVVKVKINPKKTHSMLRSNRSATAVRELFEAYVIGQYTKADLMRMSKEKGIKNAQGNWLNETSIDRMLSSPAYAGYICNKLTDWEMYDGKHIGDAIISLDLFNRVQRVLQSQSRRANKKDKRKMGANPLYPFAKWLVCPNCGKNYRGSAPRARVAEAISPVTTVQVKSV